MPLTVKQVAPAFSGACIHITGIVQGVGFRPFVYGLAHRLGLRGWVRNTSAGVDIEVDGPPQALEAFIAALQDEAPPLAHIDNLEVLHQPAQGFTAFTIVHSEDTAGAFQPISPDVTTCPDCLRELFDPADRRYRYPFINCTNCGPRFTIVTGIPYDRPNTTMAAFTLCPDCEREYHDPLDRRFHAQPVACPACGPHLWLEFSPGPQASEAALPTAQPGPSGDEALLHAQRLLKAGKIVAIKGLGGFHLACDAANPAAVAELRRRKLRVGKPFALMMPDAETVSRHCLLNDTDRELLESRARPVVLLPRRESSTIADDVAPGQPTLGVMLPYTPLHALLFAPHPDAPGFEPVQALVMTSGNLSEEPIATGNNEARLRLSALADAFLLHDRPIHTRCDDSVVRTIHLPGEERPTLAPIRRSRGYAPGPLALPWDSVPLLAGGAELKNTFCLASGRYAFLSHHIGDLENYETLRSFIDGVEHFERLFRIRPELFACDLHPNYLATRYILERAGQEARPVVGVQHHHAHIAAVLAENGLPPGDEAAIGVALDGTGYGTDGAIWGGEFLAANYRGFRRLAHLRYVPLPGGDQAVRFPWRMALSWLSAAGIEWADDLPPVAHGNSQLTPFGIPEIAIVRRQLAGGVNAAPTSSMGRLFDAAAALAGVRQQVSYEAQAAIEFEALADPDERGEYPFDYLPGQSGGPLLLDPAPLFRAMVADLRHCIPQATISARFHNGVARAVVEVCRRLSAETGLTRVALSGGVWQNMTLLSLTLRQLHAAGLKVYVHRQAPANDGGLSLGQAAVAMHSTLAG